MLCTLASAGAEWFSCCMFEEGQLYAPVTTGEDGQVTVHLGDDHPGVGDPHYRERRNHIASLALAWEPGEPLPRVDYTEEEHDVWRTVCRELAAKHERLACAEYRESAARLALPADHIPQLDEVTASLRAAHRLRVPPRRRRGALRGLLRLAGRRRLPLDPVRAPSRHAAVHARAGPDPRGDRPRQHAGQRAVRRAEPPGRAAPHAGSRPRRGATSSRACSGSRWSSA